MDLLYRQTHGSKFSELCSSFCNLLKLNNARVLFRRLEKELSGSKRPPQSLKQLCSNKTLDGMPEHTPIA